MTYLITGATGLVGRELMSLCEKQGIKVHYLTTNKQKIKNSDFSKGFYWNPNIGEIDNKAFEGVTTIIHLAGATVAKRWTKAYKKEILDSRIKTASLLHKVLKEKSNNIKHFISASAIGIYPNSYTNVYTEETSKKADDFLGKVVNQWEASAIIFKELNVDVSILRIGLVLSNKGGALPKMVEPIKKYVGASFGTGKQWQSWIHVFDLANLFMFIASTKQTGIFNAVAPNPVTQAKLLNESAQILKKPMFLPNIPTFVSKIIFGEMHILLTSSQRVISKKVEQLGFKFKYPSIKRALESLL